MVFKKRLLSSSVALAMVGSYQPAVAQSNAEIEEIIVTGGIKGLSLIHI